MTPLLTGLAWLSFLCLCAYAISRALLLMFERFALHEDWVPKSFRAARHFSGSLFAVAAVVAARISVGFFGLTERGEGRADRVTSALLVVALCWFFTRALALGKLVVYRKADIARSDNLRQRKIRTQIQFIEKVVLIFVYAIGAALVLMNFEGVRKIGTSLIASAGLAGVILGFAAQRSLANLAAGFQIAFTQPLRIDDVVVVEGEWGKIEEITLTYVVVRTWDLRALVVPISYFVEKPFENWTRVSSEVLGTVSLRFDFAMPIEPLREEFARILKGSRLWDGRVSAVQVTDASERSQEIRFLMGARNAGDAFDLRCLVRERIIAFVRDQYPSCLPKQRVEGNALVYATQESLAS